MLNTTFIFGLISIAISISGVALVYACKPRKGRQTHTVHCEVKVNPRRTHHN